MAKKRTSLDSLFANTEEEQITKPNDREVSNKKISLNEPDIVSTQEIVEKTTTPKNNQPKTESGIVKQTVYLPAAVHEQLRQLAFEERRKMHDYLMEGLDRVFKNRGLKSNSELVKR